MIWLILFIIISSLAIALAIIPIARDVKAFKYGQVGEGVVVNISSYFDMSKKERNRINVQYDADNRNYTHTFSLYREECTLKTGDKVTLLYNVKNPKNAHISADSDSFSHHFQRLIIILAVIAVLIIGLRSLLMYFDSTNNSSLISIIAFSVVALITLAVLAIYIYIRVKLLNSGNIVVGEIVDKIDKKGSSTYRVKYSINRFLFTFLFNSNDSLEIGANVQVAYLENAPFISHIIK